MSVFNGVHLLIKSPYQRRGESPLSLQGFLYEERFFYLDTPGVGGDKKANPDKPCIYIYILYMYIM